jgi:3-(3-hydroxy-phenyl)propionate hydroxylase
MTIPVGQSYTDEEILDPKYANSVFQRVLKTPPEVQYPIVHQSVYRVHQRVANQFRRERVLLAGDSAHVNNPLGGFGLNSGIHDAMNLTEKLSRVVLGGESSALLDVYERQRKTVNMEYVQEISIKNKHNLEEADPQVRHERFAQLRKINASEALSREYLLVSSMINSIKKANSIS